MRYYFFETSEQMRDSELKPTLRALPGQTFPDGTPVDTDYNVRAPKKAGSSAGGNRLEYPLGTIFCSTFLKEITTSRGNSFYTVYDSERGQEEGQADPDFHPVSTRPGFKYVKPEHESKKMNAAYVSFTTFGEQSDGEESEEPVPAPRGKVSRTRFSPSDRDGRAVGPIEGWAPAYDDQVKTEAEIVATWMNKMLRELGIFNKTAKRPKADATSMPLFELLYRCGESADTIAVRSRFNKMMSEEKMDISSLQVISQGPLEWYLGCLKAEHDRNRECSCIPRNAEDPKELDDLAYMVSQGMNRQTGVMDAHDAPGVKEALKKALEAGWTLDTLLEPEVLTAKPDLAALSSALASGAIPPPEDASAGTGNSYIDTLLKLKQNRRPADKDGFHVDKDTWKKLVLNLNRKKNTLLVGPTGTGKTAIVQKLCEQTGTPFTIIPMGTITDPTEQMVGKMDIASNPNSPKMETEFDWADFALAIQRPGVVLLDEVNRIPRNGFNILFSVLDGTRTLVASGAKSSDKRTIQVHPDCVFFATANIGGEYVGTDDIDVAFDDRFRRIELDYLDLKTETEILVRRTGISREDAQNIALVAKNIRNKFEERNGQLSHAVSTRQTIDCAEYVRDGFSVEEALEAAFLPKFDRGVSANDNNSERGLVRSMFASRFNGTARR